MTNGADHYWIPRRLDDPVQFFFWDADVAVVVIVFLVLGSLLNHLLAVVGAAIIGVVAARSLSRIKAEGGRGVIARFLFWYTPSEWWLRARAPSHVREYTG